MKRFPPLAGPLAVTALSLAIGFALPARAEQDAQKSRPPTLKSVWKMALPADTQRVAIADLTDDKLPRLLQLNGEGTLLIRKLTAEGSTEEGSVALGTGASRFVVGHFAKGKPAQIVLPNAVFYRDGDTYRKKAVTELPEVTGLVRFEDGTEGFFVMTKDGPPTAYSLDLAADNPVKRGREMPEPKPDGGDYREISGQFPPELFENQPFPDEVKNGGIVRLFTPRGGGHLYGLFAWKAGDGSYVALVDGANLFPRPAADMKPLSKSPKLAGKILDIAMGPDPKGGMQGGLLVLTTTGEDGKGREVEFFALIDG